ncbi:MAG TPA: hypothetical protein VGD62_01035 [Acidobacteriaceae bacterium]
MPLPFRKRVLLTLLPSLLVCLPGPGLAQQPKAGSNWQHVQALPPGTGIEVKDSSSQVRCKLTLVTEDQLTCMHGSKPAVFARTEVRWVRVPHRERSALIGAGAGGGVLAISFFAATTNNNKDALFGSNFLRGEATGVGALAGGLIGGAIGAATDFSRSTVYKAP